MAAYRRWRPGLCAHVTRLSADGYSGVLALETHWRGENLSAEASTRLSFADLSKLLAAL